MFSSSAGAEEAVLPRYFFHYRTDEELIRDVFQIDSHILDHPTTGQPLCIPVPTTAPQLDPAIVLG